MKRQRSVSSTRRGKRRATSGAAPEASAVVVDVVIALALAAVAWLVRALFLFGGRDRDWPFTIFYFGDTRVFYDAALELLQGRPLEGGIPFHPPLFPLLLSAVYRALGVDPATGVVPHLEVKLVMAALGGLAIGLFYLLARPYLGRFLALAAALLSLFHFGHLVLSVAPVSEGLSMVLSLAALLIWSRSCGAHPLAAPGAVARGWGGIALGVLLGLLVLARAEGALLALLLVATLLFGTARQRVEPSLLRRRPWLGAAIALVLVVLPWTVRNARTLGELEERLGARLAEPLPRFVPVTLYGPLNLALANHSTADGTFSRSLLTSGAQIDRLSLEDPQHLRVLLHGDRMAWEFARSDPRRFGRLVLAKWQLALGAVRLGWTHADWPGGLGGHRRPVDLFLPDSAVAVWLWLPAALLGLLVALTAGRPARRWLGLTLLVSLVPAISTALFFGYARQVALVLPFWLALVPIAGTAFFRLLLRRKPLVQLDDSLGRPGGWLVAGGLLLLLFEIWGATGDRNFRATGTTIAGSQQINQDEAVRLAPLAKPRR